MVAKLEQNYAEKEKAIIDITEFLSENWHASGRVSLPANKCVFVKIVGGAVASFQESFTILDEAKGALSGFITKNWDRCAPDIFQKRHINFVLS